MQIAQKKLKKMKKGLQFLIVALVFNAGISMAQPVVNGGFENWSKKVLYETPNGYTTSNAQLSMMKQPPNVTKTADKQAGNFAVKLQTVAFDGDTIPGMLIAGSFGSGSFMGGVPYNQRPTGLTGYAKHNVKTGDTAGIVVIFMFQGNLIGYSFQQFTGIGATYTQFTTPVTFFIPVNPDTMVMIVTSSSMDNSPAVGSTLMLDNLSFTGATKAIPNGSFENWTELSFEDPDGWLSSNFFSADPAFPAVSKSTEAQNGTYSAKITNVVIIDGDTLGFLTNGIIGDDGPAGGMPVFNNPDKVKFYYKYIPVGPDTAVYYSILSKWDSSLNVSVEVEEIQQKLAPSPNFTYFEVPYAYNKVPSADTLSISFGSGNFIDGNNYVGLGSALYIDNITVTYKSTDIEEYIFGSAVSVYPNPASDLVNIELKDVFTGNVNVKIIDVNGKIVYSNQVNVPENGMVEQISLKNLNSGNYMIEFTNNKYRSVKKLQIK